MLSPWWKWDARATPSLLLLLLLLCNNTPFFPFGSHHTEKHHLSLTLSAHLLLTIKERDKYEEEECSFNHHLYYYTTTAWVWDNLWVQILFFYFAITSPSVINQLVQFHKCISTVCFASQHLLSAFVVSEPCADSLGTETLSSVCVTGLSGRWVVFLGPASRACLLPSGHTRYSRSPRPATLKPSTRWPHTLLPVLVTAQLHTAVPTYLISSAWPRPPPHLSLIQSIRSAQGTGPN